MKTMSKLYLAIVCCLFLVACDMRELCYHHDEHAYKYQVNIKAEYDQEWQYPLIPANDWKENWPDTFNVRYSDLIPLLPSGLKVMIYDTIGYDRQNIGRDGGVVYLNDLEKSFIICNNNTETIIFNDERDKNVASVTTNVVSATTKSAQQNSHSGVTYSLLKNINQKRAPEVLFVSYVPSYIPKSTIVPEELKVLLKPIVYTYYIRFEFAYGFKYVKLADGALSGMSESVNLLTQEPSDELATVMFNAKVNSSSYIDARVNSFGLPSDTTNLGKQFNDGKYSCILTLQVVLKNGYRKSFEIDVTNQVKSQPRGGVIIVKGLRVEDKEAEIEGSFDVDVDEWGDEEIVELPNIKL